MPRFVLLSFMLLAAPAARAAGWEEPLSQLGRQAAASAARVRLRVEARARVLAGAPKSTDLSAMFELAGKPAPEDLAGWFAGRRFTESGPAAALLVGGDVYADPGAGPIGGKSFKLMVLGAKEAGVVPADLYDEPGSEVVNAIQARIADDSKTWGDLRFTDAGAVWSKGAQAYELRKWGRYLVCKYPQGYGYFFKKVSPAPGAGGPKGLKAEPAPAPGAELEKLFDQGSLPPEKDVTGWFAGRRFTAGGPAAALVAGFEVYDTEAGPIEGSAFKLAVLGPDKPGIVPVDLYDIGGSAMMNGVSWRLRETAAEWTTARAGSGYVTSHGEARFEVRRSGEFIVIKYPEGFGYFFKRIR